MSWRYTKLPLLLAQKPSSSFCHAGTFDMWSYMRGICQRSAAAYACRLRVDNTLHPLCRARKTHNTQEIITGAAAAAAAAAAVAYWAGPNAALQPVCCCC
jgi:hypothetical protein